MNTLAPARSLLLLAHAALLLGACGSAFVVQKAPGSGEPEPVLRSSSEHQGEVILSGVGDDGALLYAVGGTLTRAGGKTPWRVSGFDALRDVIPLPDGGALALSVPVAPELPAEIVRITAKGQRGFVRAVPREASLLLAPGGQLVVRAESRVGALDVGSGALLWTALLSVPDVSAPATFQVDRGPAELGHDGAFYAAEPQGKRSLLTLARYALEGRREQQWPLAGVRALASLAVLDDGRIYAFTTTPDTEALGVGKDALHAFGPDGSALWSREVPLGQDVATLVVDHLGRPIVAHGSVLEAFARDGSPAWRRDVCVDRPEKACGAIRSLAVGPSGVLYVGHRTLDALDTAGNELWRFEDIQGEARAIDYAAGRLHAVDVLDQAGHVTSSLLTIGAEKPKPGSRSAAKWASNFRPGRGGLLAPPMARAAGSEAAKAKPGTRDEDLCRWGFPEGCIRRARELVDTPNGAGEALALLAPLCGRPTDPGCRSLEEIIGLVDRSSPQRATDLLAIRCAAGNRDSCERACKRGEPGSCFFACEAESVDGCANLGVMYQTGKVVRQSESRALGLFHRACAMGSKTGCERLTAIATADSGTASGFGAAEGVPSPGAEGFETYIAQQSAALKTQAKRAVEMATKKYGTCPSRDSCCLAERFLVPVCSVLGCVRVPGC